MPFEWDPAKAKNNRSKHGVSFADAIGALEDPLALTVEDEGGLGEKRYAAIGRDFLDRVLVVSFTWRSDRVRVISARRATKAERQQYEDGQ